MYKIIRDEKDAKGGRLTILKNNKTKQFYGVGSIQWKNLSKTFVFPADDRGQAISPKNLYIEEPRNHQNVVKKIIAGKINLNKEV